MIPELGEKISSIYRSPSIVQSADGKTLFSLQAEYRKPVRRDEIPNIVVNAILAAEDKRFMQHSGVDLMALGRIAFIAAKDRKASQGGSTLSMQLAKLVFTGDAPTISRKLDNMALAYKMEEVLTKDQVLELYLNYVYFGEGAHGIAAAADVYFGKTLDELTLAEAAMLARCVRYPSSVNPVRSPEKALANRNTVLRIMLEENMIQKEEFDEAIEEPVKLRKKRPQTITATKFHPYFVDYVLHELREKDIDISRGGYRVVTTLNTDYQEIAEDGVRKWVDKLKGYAVNQMALLCTDNSGRIIAMVGGPDYEKSEFNMMWNGMGRQAGSTFKPFVYAAGLENGTFRSNSTISTERLRKPGTDQYFKGGAGQGHISIPTALAKSNNTAAVRAIDEVGPAVVAQFCKNRLGFKRSHLPAVLSLALGAGETYMLEMAAAYSVFQSHGDRYTPYAIERVIEPDGSERAMAPRVARGVVSRDTAEYIDLSLRRTVTSGTGTIAGGVRNSRGKTGTTSDHKDAWFCGYSDKLLGIVWVGNEQIVDGKPVAARMRGLFGGQGPIQVWNDVIGKIQDKVGEKSRTFGGLPDIANVKRGDEDEENDVLPEPEEPIPGEGDPLNPGIIKDPAVPPLPPAGSGTDAAPPLPGGTQGSSGSTSGNTSGSSGTGSTSGSTGSGGGGERDVIYVSVCGDSGQRATAYCPEVVKRPFFKGSEPKGSCPLHGALAVRIQPVWQASEQFFWGAQQVTSMFSRRWKY